MGQTSLFTVTKLAPVQCSLAHEDASEQFRRTRFPRAQKQGDENMLGIIAAVLIVLWLLGFFAFHVTTAFIHAALIVGLILLVLHFVSGRTASV
jgi:hypothetical protein